MILFICVFSLPIAVLVAVIIYLGLRNRPGLFRLPALAAISSAFVSPIIGLWGLAHLRELQARARLDYGFEGLGWIISSLAALLAGIWFGVSRRWYSLAVFAVSSMVFTLWLMLVATF
jgi:hypothetical protein